MTNKENEERRVTTKEWDELNKRTTYLEKKLRDLKKRNDDSIKKKIYFEKFSLMSNYVFHQDNNFYFLFSIFSAMNGLILIMFVTNYSELSLIVKYGIPVFGLFICVIWLLVSGRSLRFHNDRIERASEIQRLPELINGRFPEKKRLELWDKKLNVYFRNEYLSGYFSATKVCMVFIYLIIAIWCCLIIKYFFESFYQDYIVISFIIMIIALYVCYIDLFFYPNSKK